MPDMCFMFVGSLRCNLKVLALEQHWNASLSKRFCCTSLEPLLALAFLWSVRRPTVSFVSSFRHVAAILGDTGKL